jgi:hypothetical protein
MYEAGNSPHFYILVYCREIPYALILYRYIQGDTHTSLVLRNHTIAITGYYYRYYRLTTAWNPIKRMVISQTIYICSHTHRLWLFHQLRLSQLLTLSLTRQN